MEIAEIKEEVKDENKGEVELQIKQNTEINIVEFQFEKCKEEKKELKEINKCSDTEENDNSNNFQSEFLKFNGYQNNLEYNRLKNSNRNKAMKFKCSQCDYASDFQKNLERHILRKHKALPKKCNSQLTCSHPNKRRYECQTLSDSDIFEFHKEFYDCPTKIDQDNFIVQYIDVETAKRKKKDAIHCRDLSNYYYVMRHKDSPKKIQVCKKAFCSILGIKTNRVTGVAKRSGLNKETLKENRGGDRKSLISKSKNEAIDKFLSQFGPRNSLLNNSKLDPNLSLTKLFKMYNDEATPGYTVSRNFFTKVFKIFFNENWEPSKTNCEFCMNIQTSVKTEKNEDERRKLFAQYKAHISRARLFYNYLKEEKSEVLIMSFNTQKDFPLPKLNNENSGLCLYNFTIVVGNSKKFDKENVHSFIWTEDQASKSLDIMCSAIFYLLSNKLKFDRIQTLRILTEEKNKNSVLIGTISNWFSHQKIVKKVELIFPVEGHGRIPSDRVFKITDVKCKRKEIIENPEEYVKILSVNANVYKIFSKVPVHDWKNACDDALLVNLHFKLNQVKRIIIEKQKDEIVIRGEKFYKIDTCLSQSMVKKGKSIVAIQPELKNAGSHIKQEKIDELKKMLEKHYGDQWMENKKLAYYKNVLTENNFYANEEDVAYVSEDDGDDCYVLYVA